ncbi:MAG: 6-pyruvoyl-tetrahydropterin synthase-related protein, partial [Candidatus Gottesmanbacteria bacterium]
MIVKNNRIIILFVIISAITISVFLYSSLFKAGIPSGHDIPLHIFRSKLFIDALNQGQFPVRWSEWLYPGQNVPSFNFYPVGFYYLVAIIYFLIPSVSLAFKTVILLTWLTGGLLMFLYAKRFGLSAGLLASIIYIFTPYFILDIFVRGSYSELTAIVFCTGLLWSLDRFLVSNRLIYSIFLSLFLAGAIISHLPTLVIITPVLLGYYLLLKGNGEVKAKNTSIIISLIMGIGLSAFW